MVPNTLPLETTLTNRIGTDVEVQTDVSTPIQRSSSVILMIKGYQNKAGQLICVAEGGKQAGVGNAGTGGCRNE